MNEGFETYRPNGSTAMNGASLGGVFLGMYTIPGSSASGSASFTQAPAGAIYCCNSASGSHDFDNNSTDAYGRINWTRRAGETADSTLLVFTHRVNPADTYGAQIFTDGGNVLLDTTYPVPQYAGSVQPAANATAIFPCPNGMQANIHNVSTNLRPGTNRIVMVNLPDSGTNDIWYSCDSFIPASATSSVALNVTVFTPPGASYQVPTLHIYALDGPVSAGFGLMEVYKADQTLVYDASAENMNVIDMAAISYPAIGSTATYPMNMPASAGVSIPFYYKKVGGNAYYLSCAKRVGAQLTFKLMPTSQYTDIYASSSQYTIGSVSNAYCVVVDLAQLGASGVGGVPHTPPHITTQPVTQSVPEGTVVTFSVAATGDPVPAYQWQVQINFVNTDISGATSAAYTFTASSAQNGNIYRCVVSNVYGTEISQNCSLTVTAASGSAGTPVITAQPTSKTVEQGASAVFSVTASPATHFQWYLNGNVVSGNTTPSYSPYTGATGTFNIYVICYNEGATATATSNTVTLTVTAPAGPTSPVFSLHPVDITVTQGGDATFTVSADPHTSYQWYRSGVAVSGATGAAYSAVTGAPGSFNVFARAFNGAATPTDSDIATLTVNAPPDSTPVISTYPQDTTTAQGFGVTLSCVASPITSQEWYRNGTLVGTGGTHSPDVSVQGTFTYTCTCRNGTASQSASATLTVTAPPANTFPSYQNNNVGVLQEIDSPAAFGLNADGTLTSGGHWANGSGSASLYTHNASGSGFVGATGSDTLGDHVGTILLAQALPANPGASRVANLTITTRITSSGSVVCTQTVTLTSTNS